MKKQLAAGALLSSFMIAQAPAQAESQYEYDCIKPDESFPHIVSNIGCFRDGLIPVENSKAMGYANTLGELVVPYQYEAANNFYDGLASVAILKKGKKGNSLNDYATGYINNTGELVIGFDYDYHSSGNFMPNVGAAWVGKQNKIGLIDKTGKILIPLQYEEINDFMENGLAWVKKDKKWGLIDQTGAVIIPFSYDDYVGGFSSQLPSNRHLVAKKGKYGYVDDFGQEITPLKYDKPFSDYGSHQYWFENGVAELTIKGKPSCLRVDGKETPCPKYD